MWTFSPAGKQHECLAVLFECADREMYPEYCNIGDRISFKTSLDSIASSDNANLVIFPLTMPLLTLTFCDDCVQGPSENKF